MNDPIDKVVRLSELREQDIGEQFSDSALCFGHFNVIHPGHLRYFEQARTHGKTLIVALEGDQLISNVESDRIFPEIERANAVSTLQIVDLVVVLDNGTLDDLIPILRPSLLVVGKEFRDTHQTRIAGAIKKITDLGGRVLYDVGEIHYATADFLHGSPNEVEEQRWRQFNVVLKKHDIVLSKLIDEMIQSRSPRILVIGDSIVDQYIACDPLGMSNEAPVIVVKEIESRDFIGGAAIVAAHVSALGATCDFISVIGVDEAANIVRSQLNSYRVNAHLFEDGSRPTTFKLRYMVENQKLFRVSRLKEHSLDVTLEKHIIERVLELAPLLDGIIVSDFVYGVISSRVLQALTTVARNHNIPLFGDLQCSSQIGNVLKFKDFRLLCPTEREARIALANHEDGVERIANLLIEDSNTENLILKLGAGGFIAYEHYASGDYSRREYFPALTVNPIDVTGAGDSLLAATSVLMASGYDLIKASAMATCIASVAVQTVGNVPIELSYLSTIVRERSRELT